MLLVELCEFENAGPNEVPGMMLLVVRGGWIGVHFHRPNAEIKLPRPYSLTFIIKDKLDISQIWGVF
jgi:hypothetical protein